MPIRCVSMAQDPKGPIIVDNDYAHYQAALHRGCLNRRSSYFLFKPIFFLNFHFLPFLCFFAPLRVFCYYFAIYYRRLSPLLQISQVSFLGFAYTLGQCFILYFLRFFYNALGTMCSINSFSLALIFKPYNCQFRVFIHGFRVLSFAPLCFV